MPLLQTTNNIAALGLALTLLAVSMQAWPGGAVLTASLDAVTEPVRHLEIARLPRY